MCPGVAESNRDTYRVRHGNMQFSGRHSRAERLAAMGTDAGTSTGSSCPQRTGVMLVEVRQPVGLCARRSAAKRAAVCPCTTIKADCVSLTVGQLSVCELR